MTSEELKEKEKIYDISDGDEAIKALKREYNKRHPQTEYLKMANGKKIKISDMEDSHILNAIKVIEIHMVIEEECFFDQLEYYD